MSGQDTDFNETEASGNIESSVNTFFEAVYSRKIGLEQAINYLLELKNSSNEEDQLKFSHTVQNMMDECRFFSKYPTAELELTANFFGLIVHNRLVSFDMLGMCLKTVLDSLRQPKESKLFKFGLIALSKFESRLVEWPQYCIHLLNVPQLLEENPSLLKVMESIRKGQHEGNSIAKENLSFGTASAMPLLHVQKKQSHEPSESIKEKIAFVINNLSSQNLPEKVQEFLNLLPVEYFPWFASYFVIHRISIEPNFQKVYLQFVKLLKSPQLETNIMEETLTNLKLLLKSSTIMDSSSERILLKNLGFWLGSTTIAQNFPILTKDLCLKVKVFKL